MDEHFPHFEALLSRGNIFATPIVPVNVINPPVSQQPFIDPNASTRATGLVWPPAEQASNKGSEVKTTKDSKKKHKSSHHKSSKSKPLPVDESTGPVQEAHADTFPQRKPVPVKPLNGPELAASDGGPVVGIFDSAATRVEHPLPDTDTTFAVSLDEPLFGENITPEEMVSDEGELADTDTDKPERNEMIYRETVRSIRAFMSWNFIPDFELEYSDPDKSNNPWRGKNPKASSKISVEMPADDWLCQNLETLILTVAEGYPSRGQEAGGLHTDQFIRTPKPQDKWYPIHKLKTDGPHRSGRKLFNWHGSEVKLNAQFSRIVKPAAYLATGPVSRPVLQEVLHQWERCAREPTYTVNHAAEIQDQMTSHITFLQTHLSKGK